MQIICCSIPEKYSKYNLFAAKPIRPGQHNIAAPAGPVSIRTGPVGAGGNNMSRSIISGEEEMRKKKAAAAGNGGSKGDW